MKKKIVTAVLAGISALVLACGLAACGGTKDPQGEDGLWSMSRVYAKAQELGFEGTFEELVAMFKGEDGKDGQDGQNGKDGRGITGVELDDAGNLVVLYSDGTRQTVGKLPQQGSDGKDETQGLFYRTKTGAAGDYLVVAGFGTAWEAEIAVPETCYGLPVKEIGYGAFADGADGHLRYFLTGVTLPASITAIGEGAFAGCSLLERVTFAAGSKLGSVGVRAFDGCSSLTEIILPASMRAIGEHAFAGSSLEKVYFEGTPSAWKELVDAEKNPELAQTPCSFFSQEEPDKTQWAESGLWWHYGAEGAPEEYIRPAENAELTVHFPELGNGNAGDCVLIKTGDTEVLIDAGSRKSSAKTLVPYIKQYCTDGILEYVIATHAHQDHIAAFVGESGAPGIFESFVCKTIIDYARTGSTTQIKKDYEAARDAEVSSTAGAVHYTALQCWNNADGAKRSYELAEGVTMNILYNYYYEHSTSDENDYSVCMLLTQGENHFLFTGDLEESGEKYLVQYNPGLPHVKLFKAGHHGSETSSNDVLLSKITPENVCVCCYAGSTEYTTNKDNTFPTQDMINRVGKYTKNIYVTTMSTGSGYTSMNGNITVTSNAAGVTVHGSASDTILKETAWFRENRTWPQDGVS